LSSVPVGCGSGLGETFALSVVIGVRVGCTRDPGWCGRPVRWVDVAECAAWAWWKCTVMLLCPIEDRGEADSRLSSVIVLRVLLGDGCVTYVLGLFFTVLLLRMNCSWFGLESHCSLIIE
jgi:hypothetical protein